MPQSEIKDNSYPEISADTIKSTSRLADSLDLFNVDDYPITEKQLIGKYAVVTSGKSKSYDKAWFKNDSINQSLVIELYTDYHRFVIYCFDNKNIPIELIERLNLNIEGGDIAPIHQKQKIFKDS